MATRTVLFPTDLSSNSDILLCHALFQAEIRDAELHILHIVTWEDKETIRFLPDPDQILAQLEASARVQLAESLARHKDKVLHIEERTLRSSQPGRLIVDYAQRHHCELIVMGCHGRKGFKHMLLGSVAEEVARTADCPVLTVRIAEPQQEVRPIKNILVPVDFSAASREALRRASKEAVIHGSRILAHHVIQHGLYPIGPEPGLQPIIDLLPGLEASREKILTQWLKDNCDASVSCTGKVTMGTPYQILLETAKEQNADLMVMGTHGYSGLAHLVLGSTAERVIRFAPCPVLVVKAPATEKEPSGSP